MLLAIASCGLVWAYHGELDQLLPLYAVGVFTAFTLSQAGMVAHWRRIRARGHRLSVAINAVGAVATGLVALILFVTKFAEGAWLILVLTVVFFAGFRSIKRRYDSINAQLAVEGPVMSGRRRHTVLLLVPRVHRGIVAAADYAASLHGEEVRALHVAIDAKGVPELKARWNELLPDIPLIVLESPFRTLLEPVLEYVDELRHGDERQTVTVIVPEAVPTRWYHRFLQENLAFRLKFALGGRKNVVLTNVRYFLE